MKKKAVLLLSTFTTFGVVAATLVLTNYGDTIPTSGAGEPSVISLSSSAAVQVSPDDPLVHQVNVRNNKFDVVGYDANGGAFGSIQKTTLGFEEYRGMVYNRSAINGFNMLTVKFSGGPLNYVFTDFLMEDMTFTGQALTSESPVYAPEGKAYFIIFTTDDSKVNIDYVNILYSCDGSIDEQMIFDKDTELGGARSNAKSFYREDSFIEIENNPQKNNNNYSTGSWGGHNSAWYRWNGKFFKDSEILGKDFEFGMTIMGTYERMTDENKYFHYGVWPQFGYYDKNNEPYTDNDAYAQTYIGNDNYEPLGKDNALHPSDPLVNESYPGRFFTDYGWYNNAWQFADPDNTLIPGTTTTYRKAYEAFNMPFWFVKFHVYFEEGVPVCDSYVNGFKTTEAQELFEVYDTENNPDLFIKSLPMHVVNYGIDAEGNPGESYKGWFTYPRLIEDKPEQKSPYYLKGTFNTWAEHAEYNFIQDVGDANHYSLENVELSKDDELKVNDPSLGNDGWYTNNHTYDNCHYTIKENGNLIISETGTYDVHFYLNSEDGNHITLSLHEEPVPPVEEVTYTATDLPDWLKVDDAEIFAWVWGPSIEGSGKWVEVTVDGTSGSFTVESELTGFLLVRCFAGTTTPNWEAQGDVDGRIYNNTGDILCSSGVHSYSASIWYSHN